MSESEASTFLGLIHGQKPPEAWAYLWRLDNKRSYWSRDLAVLEKAAASYHLADLYTGVGWAGADLGPSRRATSSAIIGLPGLWLDLDVAGPAHRSPALPSSREAAQQWAASLPHPPTITVDSGWGYQLWWLFDEPWLCLKAAERARAQDASRAWTAALQASAHALGWGLDSTWDLARILRVPGTRNNKVPGEPRDVRLLDASGPRYSPSELLRDVEHGEGRQRPSRAAVERLENGITLDPQAVPPWDKFQAMLDTDAKFRATWEGRRRDFEGGRASPSAYDMSLATIATGAGWSPQETVNLLLAWRRKHGHDLKLRHDYYATTIANAQRNVSAAQAGEALADATAGEAADTEDEPSRAQLLTNISAQLGAHVTEIRHTVADPDEYTLVVDGRALPLGDASVVVSQTKFRDAWAAAANRRLPEMPKGRWHTLSDALLRAAVVVGGEDDTAQGRFRGLLEAYFHAQDLGRPAEADAAYTHERLLTGAPIWEEGGATVLVRAAHLKRWLWSSQMERPTERALGLALRAAGGQHTTRATIHLWRIPWPQT